MKPFCTSIATVRLLRSIVLISPLFSTSVACALEGNPVAAREATIVSGNARFTILTPALLRLEYSPGGTFEERASLTFVNRALPVPQFKVQHEGPWLTIQTAKLTLRWRTDALAFTTDSLSIQGTSNKPGANFTWHPGMPDTGNLGGTARTLDSIDGPTPLEPGILSRNGWTLVDDSHRTLLEKTSPGAKPWVVARPAPDTHLDWYFFGYAHDYKRALTDYTAVAGKVPMIPKWAFGAWWSRYWAYKDTELKQLVSEFRTHGVPLDVLVVDMDWHLPGWTGYTWNPEYFPDPDGFLKWAHDEGLHVTLNLHPADGVGRHERAFPEVANAMGVDPEKSKGVPFDMTDRRYVDAYFKYLHHPLEQQGVDFWWIDWQQGKETRMQGLDPLPWLNHLHWDDMEQRLLRGAGETRHVRPLLFSRWGGLGNHRYQTGFSGDTFNTWKSLDFQPYFTSTAGNVAYDYWSHDIGGHQPGPVAPELYSRWMQWAALNPVLRTHGGKNPATERRIWAFPPDTYRIAKEAWLLRYSLVPYMVAAARQCYDSALPLLRPLYYEWPEHEQSYAAAYRNEYMFGNDLLVHPVTAPADDASSCVVQSTWLPPGKWVDWFTGESWQGPRVINQLVPEDRIPLWARAGAIIPRAGRTALQAQSDTTITNRTRIRGVKDLTEDTLWLDIFPGGPGEAVVYQDDGESTDYQRNRMLLTKVHSSVSKDGTSITITVDGATGNYFGMPKQRTIEVTLHGSAQDHASGEAFLKSAGPVDIRKSVTFQLRSSPVTTSGTTGQSRLRAADSILQMAGMDEAGQRKLLLQTLGIVPQLSFRADSSNSANLSAKLDLRFLEPLGLVNVTVRRQSSDSITSQITLDQQPGESRTFTHAWPLTVGAGTLHPMNINVQAELIWNSEPGGSVTMPLHGSIFPSINQWWVVGPFDNPDGTSLDRKFAPEGKGFNQSDHFAGLSGDVSWQSVKRPIGPSAPRLDDEFVVHLHDAFGRHFDHAMAYAYTTINAPREMNARLEMGGDDGLVAWVNGAEVWRNAQGRPYHSREDKAAIHLIKGTNALMLKISQGDGGWAFGAHVFGDDGSEL